VSRARSGEPLAAITGVSSVPQNAGLLSSEYNKDKRMSDTKSRDTARVPYGGRPGRGWVRTSEVGFCGNADVAREGRDHGPSRLRPAFDRYLETARSQLRLMTCGGEA